MRTAARWDVYTRHAEQIASRLPSLLAIRALAAASLLMIVLATAQLVAGMYVIGDPTIRFWFNLSWSIGILVAILVSLAAYRLHRRRVSDSSRLIVLTFVILKGRRTTLGRDTIDLKAAEDSATRLASLTEELNARREGQLASAVWSVRSDLLDRLSDTTGTAKEDQDTPSPVPTQHEDGNNGPSGDLRTPSSD